MAKSQYFLNLSDRNPARTAVVYSAGAFVNGAQADVATVTVHAGHALTSADKFLYALNRRTIIADRVFTVDTAAATSIALLSATASFPDLALLVNVEGDTGGEIQPDGSFTRLNFDGSGVTVYNDPAGDSVIANARVPVDTGGEVFFYGDGGAVWILLLDAGNRPLRVYPDVSPLPVNAVTGPATSTDDALVRFNGTGGATLQDSGATLTDAGLLTATSFAGDGSALTGIAEANIADGSILARVGGSETITGAWSFTNAAGLGVTNTVTAGGFSGSGASLTGIPETAITDGSLLARLTANETFSHASGISVTNTLAAGTVTGANVTSGTNPGHAHEASMTVSLPGVATGRQLGVMYVNRGNGTLTITEAQVVCDTAPVTNPLTVDVNAFTVATGTDPSGAGASILNAVLSVTAGQFASAVVSTGGFAGAASSYALAVGDALVFDIDALNSAADICVVLKARRA